MAAADIMFGKDRTVINKSEAEKEQATIRIEN